jgi:hypothetical protein
LAETHETAESFPVPDGSFSFNHEVPFHRTANPSWREVLLKYEPTAVQAEGEVQETPKRLLDLAPAGIGTVSSLQLPAFSISPRAV